MLFRSERGIVASSDYVQFWMDDQQTPGGIACRVSREALVDRLARDGFWELKALETAFNIYRTEIEQVASRKHAAGAVETAGYVLIATPDLNTN